MKKKLLTSILILAVIVAGCGKLDEKKTLEAPEKQQDTTIDAEIVNDNIVSQEEDEGTEELVEEAVEEVVPESVPVEQVQPKATQKTEQKKTQTDMPAVTTPAVNETVATTPESEVKVEACTHWYQPVETKNCTSIKKMVWACNGCGYALFDISSTDYSPINFPNMYVHPPCETGRFDEPCCGGGYHSEAYYYWEGCYECHSPIILRSCTTFYVMAERCIQNESNFGPYEKVETGHAYIKSCDCGKNLMVSGDEGGMVLLKEQCCYCGDVKTYPEK